MSSIGTSVSAFPDSSCLRRWLEPRPRGLGFQVLNRSYGVRRILKVGTGLLIQLMIIRIISSPPIGTINLLKV